MKKELNPGERCEARVYGKDRWSGPHQCDNRASTEREESKRDWSNLQDGESTVVTRTRRVCGTHARTKYSVSFVPTAEEQRWRDANETWRAWKKHERRAEEQLAQARKMLWGTGLAECPECEHGETFWRTDLPQHRKEQHGVPTEAEFWDELLASLDAPLEAGDRIGQNT